jgi:nucleoid DNA-binding protein/DNA-directed RNA polymerase subunit RPC12/RpoP
MSTTYLKADLIAELASAADIPRTKAEIVVNQLAQIAYREARAGFTIPGICKLDVVRRKARHARLPRTGQRILIDEHDALRARPLQKAKHAVAPMMPGMVKFVDDAPESADAARSGTQPPQAATDNQPFNPEGLVSFRCGACGQEIEAPFDMAGAESECPACSGKIEVPYVSEPGTIWGRAIIDTKPTAPAAVPAVPALNAAPNVPASPAPPSDAKLGRTIRIELPDDA